VYFSFLVCQGHISHFNKWSQALKRDKDNNQILRDLSLLQIQMRENAGFAETRRQLLTLNAKNRNYWIGFVVATHYAGDLPKALLILESYESTLEKVEAPEYEHGELLLYKAQILEEIAAKAEEAERAPLLQKCLTHLETSERLVMDKVSLRERRGDLLLRLGRREEAEQVYRELIRINSENYAYHDGLLKSRGYDDSAVTSAEHQQALLGDERALSALSLTLCASTFHPPSLFPHSPPIAWSPPIGFNRRAALLSAAAPVSRLGPGSHEGRLSRRTHARTRGH
jgi:tetratricopeptide (TPR) repeat protein